MGTRGKKKKDFDNCYGQLKTARKIYILEEIEGFDRNTVSWKGLLLLFKHSYVWTPDRKHTTFTKSSKNTQE